MCVGGILMSTMATSGRVSSTRRSSSSAVARLADDLEAGLREQPREALAQQRLVVGDHYPHGSSARMVTRSPSVSRRSRGPSSAPTRSSRSTSSSPSSARRLDLDDEHVVRRARARTVTLAGRSADCLRDDEVGGRLDGGGEPPVGQRRRSGSERAVLGQRLDGGGQSSSASTAGKMPCASSRSSSTPRAAPPRPRRCERGRLVAVGSCDAQQPDRQREPDEPLLGAVVEVALEPLALGVAGLDDPRARGAELLELRPHSACRRSFSSASRAAAHLVDELPSSSRPGAWPSTATVPPVAHERSCAAGCAASSTGGPARRRAGPSPTG